MIYCGDCLEVLKTLPPQKVNMIMTSPPYWALRDYGDNVQSIWDGEPECEHEWGEVDILRKATPGDKPSKNSCVAIHRTNAENRPGKPSSFCTKCGAWKGQLGLEPSFELYIKHLCDIFDEAKRVLRDDGTCWVNLGDTYGGSKIGNTNGLYADRIDKSKSWANSDSFKKEKQNIPTKSLCLIPQRFAIEMVSRGWILRNTIIWHKPNCMPSSAKDRFTVDYEYLFFFSKKKKYYFEQQLERFESNDITYNAINTKQDVYAVSNGMNRAGGNKDLGRNKRSVWSICPQPYPEAHFATYPEELCVTPISAGCPLYVCKKCGKPREKVLQDTGDRIQQGGYGSKTADHVKASPTSSLRTKSVKVKIENGYTDCGCGVGFEPGIVLDPFFGSGTTGLTALKLGRDFIGIEQNAEYIKLAEKRLSEEMTQERLSL